MSETKDYIKELGVLLKALEKNGFTPVMVGGMALVTLGSRRVTRDFDFIISKPEQGVLDLLFEVFYKHGFQLAAKMDEFGNITDTIDNKNVASIRFKIDQPASIYLINPKTRLRVDLLFDFPLPAKELLANATKTKISSAIFYVASTDDLLRLKEIAKAKRQSSNDDQDIEFLRKLKMSHS